MRTLPLLPRPSEASPAAPLALLLALAALKVLAVHTGLALVLWALGGVLLAFSAPAFGELRPLTAREPMSRWEFLAWILVAFWSFGLRLWALNDYPPGAVFPEAAQVARMELLAHHWVPHLDAYHDNFPTLTYYQSFLCERLFGWSPASFRIPAALWGGLGAVAFGLFLRRLVHPAAALAAGLLLAGDNLFLVISRIMYPSSIVIFAVAGAAYFLALGLQRRNLWPFAAAGFCGGLSLHGYFPGRPVIGLFLVWFGFLWFFRPRLAPGWRQVLTFVFLFVVSGAPTIWYALTHPEAYWRHMGETGGNRLAGTFLATFREQLPTYAKVFHLIGDGRRTVDDGLPMIPLLKPDLLAQALFPLGLAASVTLFWRPLPALGIGILLLGLLPGMLGTLFPHPTTRRIFLVSPAVYLFLALAADRLLASARRWGTVPARISVALLLAAAGLMAWRQAHSYFVELMSSPEMKVQMSDHCRQAARIIRANPGAELRLGKHLRVFPECILMYPKNLPHREAAAFDDSIDLPADKPSLLLLNPSFEPLLPLYKARFPGAEAWAEPGQPLPKGEDPRQDLFNPQVYFCVVKVPAAAAAAARGMEDPRDPAGPGFRVAEPSFGETHAGKSLRLRGLLPFSAFPETLTFEFGWPGWSLRVNGVEKSWGKAFPYWGESVLVEIQGSVPKQASGSLPLRIQTQRQGQRGPESVLKPGPPMGLTMSLRPGPENWKGAPAAEWMDPFPCRYLQERPLPMPSSLRGDGTLTVPTDGLWRFRQKRAFHPFRLFVDGKLAFDKERQDDPTWQPAFQLKAGVPVSFRLEMQLLPDGVGGRAIYLEVQGPGEQAWRPLPLEWLRPSGRTD